MLAMDHATRTYLYLRMVERLEKELRRAACSLRTPPDFRAEAGTLAAEFLDEVEREVRG